MKFSVLLPTRNRLEYLRFAIETVRRQDYPDWEIIVSDNASEEDIAGYVRELGEPRIRYFRTTAFVPVTDNWNNALDQSSGEYVVMLGDDDGLLPGYFTAMLGAITEFPDPDFVYCSALFYAYPGVMPDAPRGFLREDHNGILGGKSPFWLDAVRARDIARGYLDFRMPVASNMQFSLISRRAIVALSRVGSFFKSPYPDFYATPALFLMSPRILVYPKPLVVIGITPKSYGFFHFNNRAIDGVKFLNNDPRITAAPEIRALMLPGTSYNDSWLLAMEALRTHHSEALGLLPNYRRYRFLQILHCYKKRYFDGTLAADDLAVLRAQMTLAERLAYGVSLRIAFGALRMVPGALRGGLVARLRRVIGQHGISAQSVTQRNFGNLVEVFESMDGKQRDGTGN
jgi:glycosyltransferase involved in cell wall biosynthesis